MHFKVIIGKHYLEKLHGLSAFFYCMDMKKRLRLHAFQSSIIKNPEKLHARTILFYNQRHIIFQKVTW